MKYFAGLLTGAYAIERLAYLEALRTLRDGAPPVETKPYGLARILAR